jgi:transposase
LHYRLNANLLRHWVAGHQTQQPQQSDTVTPVDKPMPIEQAGFVPLQLNMGDTAASTPDIVIDIRRGAAIMAMVRWLASDLAKCAT